jgi:hypothetical protein
MMRGRNTSELDDERASLAPRPLLGRIPRDAGGRFSVFQNEVKHDENRRPFERP